MFAGTAPGVSLAPSSLTFTSQAVGTTSTIQSVTLTNSGTSTLTLTAVTWSGDFAEANTCGTLPREACAFGQMHPQGDL